MQLIPISDVASKNDFTSINNISRDDLLAALRIPLQLMGILPQNVGGFGSKREAPRCWLNELVQAQARPAQMTNGWGSRSCYSDHTRSPRS